MSDIQNRVRAFSDVITLEAWHDSLNSENPRVDLYANVVFGCARIRAEGEGPLARFRLSVRRAQIHFVIPGTERIRLVPASIVRPAPHQPLKQTTKTERVVVAKSEEMHKLAAGLSFLDGGVKGGEASSKGKSTSKREMIEETKVLMPCKIWCRISDEGNHLYDVASTDGGALEGPAWDPQTPRAVIEATRAIAGGELSPGGVRLEARCVREDLVIEDVEIKQDHPLAKRNKDDKAKQMAVIQYIKNELARSGLEARHVEDPFGLLTMAWTIAQY